MAITADEPSPLNALLSSEAAGRLISVSSERIRQLSKLGWIPKTGRDQFRLVDLVQGYIRFLRHEDRRTSKSAADSRVRDARAIEIEQRVALRSGELMEFSEHTEIITELCGLLRSELSGLPARVTRDLPERRRIEQAVNETLRRISACARENGRVAETP